MTQAIRNYPAFDTENAAWLALEGRLLVDALAAVDQSHARSFALEFLSTRQHRAARLPADIRGWENAVELNEGLADYTGILALISIANDDGPDSAQARRELDRFQERLRDLVRIDTGSARNRHHQTGAAMGLLLDRIQPGWRAGFLRSGLSLSQALSAALAPEGHGVQKPSQGGTPRTPTPSEMRGVVAYLDSLGAARRQQREALVSRDGMHVMIEPDHLAVGALDLCGFDPMNLLHTPDGILHPGFVSFCLGESFQATFQNGAVEELEHAVERTPAGEDAWRVLASRVREPE